MAIEIERTAKANHRLAQILTLYQGCSAIDRVLYLAQGKLARRVARQAELLGMGELVGTGPIGDATIETWRGLLLRVLDALDCPAGGITYGRGENDGSEISAMTGRG